MGCCFQLPKWNVKWHTCRWWVDMTWKTVECRCATICSYQIVKITQILHSLGSNQIRVLDAELIQLKLCHQVLCPSQMRLIKAMAMSFPFHGLVQERRNSCALAMELRFLTNPSICQMMHSMFVSQSNVGNSICAKANIFQRCWTTNYLHMSSLKK